MKSLFLKTLILTTAFFAAINMQAMEQQETNNYSLLVEALDEALKHGNTVVCAELFKGFNEELIQKESVEQIQVIVDIIHQTITKNSELTVVFCNVLVNIFSNISYDLTAIMQEIITPIVNPLIEANNVRALERIACIFADNKKSHECISITEAIEHNTTAHNNKTTDTDQDEAIARLLQESPDEHATPADNDEELDLALTISASEFDNPNAPTAEDLRDLDEEAEVSIAIEESLQTQTTNNPSMIKTIFDIFLGGFGS